MSNGLEKYEPPQIAELDEWANKLFESGMFTDAKSVAQAFVKIAAGAEIGLTPFQSMTGVHFIQGKPVVGAGALASMLDRAPYNYTTDWEPSIEAPTACTITVFKHGVERGKARFSLEDAKRAGLTGGNWQKYPTDMLFARTVSQAARRYAPGATGTTFYVEAHGEMEIQPDGVTAKPRTRVTAEVITDAEVEEPFDPATEPAPSVVKPPGGPLSEPLAAGPLPLRQQLTHMSAQEKADLWSFAGLERKTRMADVKARLIAYADELGLDFTEEPDARRILDTARDAQPKGDAEAFDIFAKTGQSVDPGDQVEFDEVMT